MDPRAFHRKPGYRKPNRKALQMCAQIAQTLNSVLAWECGDELLQNLQVESVQPAPNSLRVLVTVRLAVPEASVDVNQILQCLHRFAGKLRTEVALAIHRKKVPELVFRVLEHPV